MPLASGRVWVTVVDTTTPSSGKIVAAACTLILVCTLVSAGTDQQSSTAGKKTNSHSQTRTPHATSRKGKKSKKSAGNWRHRGQQKIDPQRAREIQEALIREHYLDGKAAGVWDASSQKAMERYQSDNGWQSKTVPDSRALIKMGLGPDHEHLLNPESAMTTQPKAPAAVSVPAHSDDPASNNQPQK